MLIKLISWNIWFGTYLDKVIDFLQKSHADIIGLQEVTQTPESENNLAVHLAKELEYYYVYATGMDLRKYGKPLVMGNAVLSKYPILSSQTHLLSKTDSRVAIQADIQIENTQFHILSTHLIHTHQKPSSIQEEQARYLISVLPKEKAIVMGDFNATPESNAIQLLANEFHNAGSDLTQPTWSVYPEGCDVCLPQGLTTRLDYIFTTYDITQKQFKIIQSDASDHLPIVLEIEL